MMKFGSVVPEREYLPFYIVAQSWFTRWQKYTGCFQVDDSDDDDDDEVFPNKDSSKVVLGPYPGAINESFDLRALQVAMRDVMVPEYDNYGSFYMKASAKEGQDYQLVS